MRTNFHEQTVWRTCIRISGKVTLKSAIIILLFLFICEYLIYPIVLFQCSWPKDNYSNDNDEAGKDHPSSDSQVLRAMLLADTHLLGPYRGHWFDKLRREWQMHRAFQTAMSLFQPDVVFFLGDVFDEGHWVNEEGFKSYVKRFQDLFSVTGNGKTRSFVVSGNHDMGFHYEIIPYLHGRFNKAFNTTSVRLLKLKGSNFVLLNSMAMQMDGCFLCSAAMESLRKISGTLECERSPDLCPEKSARLTKNVEFSEAILLQHFPMHRDSDEACTGEDVAPESEKLIKFREAYDCLSKESSNQLFKLIRPRLILSGHTHHHCVTKHVPENAPTSSILEYSVPSFSWRNRNDPSFYLAFITPTRYTLSKCYLPRESTVYMLYTIGGIILVLWILPICHYLRSMTKMLSFPMNDSRYKEKRKE